MASFDLAKEILHILPSAAYKFLVGNQLDLQHRRQVLWPRLILYYAVWIYSKFLQLIQSYNIVLSKAVNSYDYMLKRVENY